MTRDTAHRGGNPPARRATIRQHVRTVAQAITFLILFVLIFGLDRINF
jgi:hypothetical protein